eukprot:651010-Amorphochlora_amoeboformis.AAC.1
MGDKKGKGWEKRETSERGRDRFHKEGDYTRQFWGEGREKNQVLRGRRREDDREERWERETGAPKSMGRVHAMERFSRKMVILRLSTVLESAGEGCGKVFRTDDHAIADLFLRDRRGDIQQASEKLREAVEWRKTFGDIPIPEHLYREEESETGKNLSGIFESSTKNLGYYPILSGKGISPELDLQRFKRTGSLTGAITLLAQLYYNGSRGVTKNPGYYRAHVLLVRNGSPAISSRSPAISSRSPAISCTSPDL